MGQSTELSSTRVVTRDGVVTATVLDRVSPDRVYLMLVKGSAAAQYVRTTDDTALVPRDVKDLLIFPKPE